MTRALSVVVASCVEGWSEAAIPHLHDASVRIGGRDSCGHILAAASPLGLDHFGQLLERLLGPGESPRRASDTPGAPASAARPRERSLHRRSLAYTHSASRTWGSIAGAPATPVGSRRATSSPAMPCSAHSLPLLLPQGSGPEDQENRRDPISTPPSRASPEPRDRARRPGSLARWRRRAAHGASPEPPPCRIVLQSRTLPAPPVAPAGRGRRRAGSKPPLRQLGGAAMAVGGSTLPVPAHALRSASGASFRGTT